jgi:hypothetical protein
MTQAYLSRHEMKYQIVLIWSGEHQAWWEPDGNGYTDDRDTAGRWWYEKAVAATKHCDPEKKISFWTARRFEQGITLEAALDRPDDAAA